MALKINQRKPEKILIGENLYILWKDGKESRHTFFELRDACPCATCVDEHTGEKRLNPNTIPADIHPRKSEYVGNYALRIYWSDAHSTGIYSFKFLRALAEVKEL